MENIRLYEIEKKKSLMWKITQAMLIVSILPYIQIIFKHKHSQKREEKNTRYTGAITPVTVT